MDESTRRVEEMVRERIVDLRHHMNRLKAAVASLERSRRIKVGRHMVAIMAELDWIDELMRSPR